MEAIETSNEWLLWVSESGRVIDASAALCRELEFHLSDLLELTKAPFDAFSTSWNDRWHSFDLEISEEFITNLKTRSGRLIYVSANARICATHRDEEEIVLLRFKEVPDACELSDQNQSVTNLLASDITTTADAAMLGSVVSSNDITTRIELQQSLKNHEKMLHVQLEAMKLRESELIKNASLLERVEEISHMGYWELDLRTGAFWGSKTAREIYGFSSETIDLQSVRNIALPECQPMLDDAINRLIHKGAQYDLEFRIRRQTDGTVTDIRSRAVFNETEQKVTGVIQNITEKKKTEGNLLKLSQAVEQSPASIYITDPDGRIEYVNPKFSEISGYLPCEIIGQNMTMFEPSQPNQVLRDDVWRGLIEGDVWRGTVCSKKKSGEDYWELVSISSVFNSKGQLTNYVAIKEDLTSQIFADVELAALSDKALKRLRYLQAAHDVEFKLRQTTSMSGLLPVIVSELSQALDMEGACLWKGNVTSGRFTPAADLAPKKVTETTSPIVHREYRISRAAQTNRPLYAKGTECKLLGLPSDIQGYGVLPLSSHGENLWAIEYFISERILPDNEWLNCLETIGAVCSLALYNMQLFEELRDAHTEMIDAYDKTLEGWSIALDLRDRDTEGHSKRVTSSAVKIARRLGFSEDLITQVRRGALLHDIGKLGVPDRILGKPGKLTAEEWEIMKLHPVYAFEWLSRIHFLRSALDIPTHHHEHWDGSGYPKGLKGEDIPVAARLFSVIDVWDALTHKRPYRDAAPKGEARQYLIDESGRLFDPPLVKMFVEMLDNGEIE
jgi:PAS domain S-box-containing protein